MKKAAIIIATLALGATAITAPAEARGRGFGPGIGFGIGGCACSWRLRGVRTGLWLRLRPSLLRSALRLRPGLWASLLQAQLLSLLLRQEPGEIRALCYCGVKLRGHPNNGSLRRANGHL